MAQISYSDALTTLSSMFGDVDHAVIKMVLDSNRGHMERTVEQLLVMSKENTSSGSPNAKKPDSKAPSGKEEVKSEDPTTSTSHSSQDFRLFDRLPPDFLRPPSYFSAPQPNQIDADRQFAQAIQDSLLMTQMRRRPERFMYPGSGPARSTSNDDTPISDKLSQLGDKARQKLAALGARFQRRQQASDRNGGGDDLHPRYANVDDGDDSSLLTREPDSSFSIGDPDGSVELQDMRFPGDQKNTQSKNLQPL